MPKSDKKEQEEEEQDKMQEVEKNEEKEVVKEIKTKKTTSIDVDAWNPKTEIGKKVKSGEIKDIDEILDQGLNILEAQIVDVLIPDVETDLLLIGQSKGKFGGGARRVFRQTQKKTREGNKPKFATVAIVGNKNGYVGLGYGKSKETVPAREKAIRNAKLNIMKIKRGNGSWEDTSTDPNTIPYKVKGKCGSAIIELIPAPNGTGLKIESECGKILKMAGITNIWSRKLGKTKSKLNLIYACMDALAKLVETKIRAQDIETLGIVEGTIKKEKEIMRPEEIQEETK